MATVTPAGASLTTMRLTVVAVALAFALLVAGCADEPAQPEGGGDAASTERGDDVGGELGEGGGVESFDDDGAAAEAMDVLDDLRADAWTALTASPQARTEVAAAAYLDQVWAVGGFDADGAASAEVLVYRPAFDEWESGPALPQAVHHPAVAAHDDGLVVVGGYTDDGFDEPTAAVWEFDPATGEWTEGPPLPEPRAAGAAASDGERVVYGGGVGPDGLAGDVWALEGGEWRALGALAQPREHLAAAGDGDGRVWLLAGRTGGLDANLATVDLVEGDRVTTVGELPTARGGVAGFYHPAVGACAVGGEEPEATFAEVECLDADGEPSTLATLEEPRHGLGAAVVGDAVYTVMGGPEPGLAVSDTLEALRVDGSGS